MSPPPNSHRQPLPSAAAGNIRRADRPRAQRPPRGPTSTPGPDIHRADRPGAHSGDPTTSVCPEPRSGDRGPGSPTPGHAPRGQSPECSAPTAESYCRRQAAGHGPQPPPGPPAHLPSHLRAAPRAQPETPHTGVEWGLGWMLGRSCHSEELIQLSEPLRSASASRGYRQGR